MTNDSLPPPHPHSRVAIGRRLRALREAMGLRPREFCTLVGIGESTWSQYEHGRRFPDILQILPLCDRFGVTLDWIYRGQIGGVPFDLAERIRAQFDRLPE